MVSRYRPERVLAIGNLLIGAGLALTGFMTGMVLLSATVLIWTLGEMMYASVAQAYLGSLAPPRMVGRYQGLYGAAYTIGTGARAAHRRRRVRGRPVGAVGPGRRAGAAVRPTLSAASLPGPDIERTEFLTLMNRNEQEKPVNDFEGLVAIVTGGAGAIGSATAKLLKSRGSSGRRAGYQAGRAPGRHHGHRGRRH